MAAAQAACIGRFRGDWGRLFRHADRDHSGALDMDEFRVSLRKLGKVPASQLGDDEVVSWSCMSAGRFCLVCTVWLCRVAPRSCRCLCVLQQQ